MFEKEAEEYFETTCLHSYADTEEQLKEDVVPAFQNGAKFGYSKANEWYYPSKNEYPKKKGTWVIGFYYGKDNWHKIFYRTDGKWWGEGQLCPPPYAWKEVVPPKEAKDDR